MATQQSHPEWRYATDNDSNGLAALFFLIGAPHIYGAMRHRSRRKAENLGAPWFRISLAIAAAAGLLTLF